MSLLLGNWRDLTQALGSAGPALNAKAAEGGHEALPAMESSPLIPLGRTVPFTSSLPASRCACSRVMIAQVRDAQGRCCLTFTPSGLAYLLSDELYVHSA